MLEAGASGDGAGNMALDHALLRHAAATGEAVLRVYRWRRPTISFGRHQPARDVYDRERLAAAGLDVVRRPTGGRAVVHDRELTYSVVAPLCPEVDRAIRVRDLYGSINGLLVRALRRLGVPAALAAGAQRSSNRGPTAVGPTATPCFDIATEGEVVALGRKLVGSAQWREGHAVLQHGSILIDDDQHRLTAVTRAPTCPEPVATLRNLLGRAPEVSEITAALVRTLGESLPVGTRLSPLDPAREPLPGLETLRAHYADERWTWGR